MRARAAAALALSVVQIADSCGGWGGCSKLQNPQATLKHVKQAPRGSKLVRSRGSRCLRCSLLVGGRFAVAPSSLVKPLALLHPFPLLPLARLVGRGLFGADRRALCFASLRPCFTRARCRRCSRRRRTVAVTAPASPALPPLRFFSPTGPHLRFFLPFFPPRLYPPPPLGRHPRCWRRLRRC